MPRSTTAFRRPRISRWERFGTTPPFELIPILCNIFQVDLDEFFQVRKDDEGFYRDHEGMKEFNFSKATQNEALIRGKYASMDNPIKAFDEKSSQVLNSNRFNIPNPITGDAGKKMMRKVELRQLKDQAIKMASKHIEDEMYRKMVEEGILEEKFLPSEDRVNRS